ncbi:phage tail protein [Pseudomonas aeruginosa]|uniref:phage tail protein n=1 Tax=Pseudomonas aeruginosa TaxID=287 RepID=UPI000F52DC3B|nr:phage tail protein [Pseudomonas aeruginosa]RQC30459.1 phage tail protein [Pseudomonas aeruginosa]HBO9079218.1 phage tail protein [Pseudomonas aeruginosa]
MAIETFNWPTMRPEAPDMSFSVRTAQFGDGYRQEVADGINNLRQSWPVTCVLKAQAAVQLLEFMERHAGAKSFLWTNPLGHLGLYTCKNPSPIPLAGGLVRFTGTFEQAFHP